jgi:acylphosphatase
MTMNTIAKHLNIRGRVQGVGFRYFMLHTAQELHVTGWVCNRADGSVEAVISGPPDAVHAMLERARRGPGHAAVTNIDVTEVQETYERFEMRPTE